MAERAALYARVSTAQQEQEQTVASQVAALQMAAADLIDLYEAKALDGDTLRAIAVTLFGVNVSS